MRIFQEANSITVAIEGENLLLSIMFVKRYFTVHEKNSFFVNAEFVYKNKFELPDFKFNVANLITLRELCD